MTNLYPKNLVKIKKLMLMLARKFANYRLHIVGIAQKKQKFLLWFLKVGKSFNQIK